MPEKTMPSSPLQFVFVGAFRESADDGVIGGQLFACRTLLNSPLSDFIDWLLLDTTMETLPPPPLTHRFFLAGKRLVVFLHMIHQPSVHGALVFCSAGYSLLEKGLMILLAHIVGKRAVLSPRSGLIVDDLKRSSLMRWFVPLVLRNSDVILCQSQSWKQLYKAISGLPDHRFSVVPNWLDTRDLANLAPRSVGSDSINVLYLGWLERYKGIYDLVEAVSYYRDEFGNCRIVICGQGSELAAVKQMIAERGMATLFDFRGWVTGEEKLSALQQADVFVLPSHREGMPNALLEAMAAGLPVIATRVGGVPEVLINDTLGILIDPGDTQRLGQALVMLKENPQKRYELGQNARDHILAYHDIDIIWPKLLSILQSE